MTLRNLIENYDSKVRTAEAMIEAETSKEVLIRLKARLFCYKAFIAELQRVVC